MTTNTTDSIVKEIQDYISRYVQVGEDELLAISLWVLHTWTFSESLPNPYTTPYLYIYSAERRSGKTRLLEVVETIVRNPLRAVDVTSAVLFRSIEAFSPTLLLDEVDALWSGAKNEELRGVLNSGYKRGGNVPRIVGGEPQNFSTFGPKALAGIDNAMLPDTVRDRCIPIHMHRQDTEKAEPFYSWEVEEHTEQLLNKIAAWAESYWTKVARERPKMIDGISDRAQEITMPLLQVAMTFGSSDLSLPNVRKILARLLTTEENLTPGAQLLSDIRDLFNEKGTSTLPGSMILDHIGGDWSGKLLASKLRPFGVSPTTVRHQNQVHRGYRRSDFEDAWSRYL